MYDLLLSGDEAMIADAVRDFLRRELPLERLRPGAAPVDEKAVWQRMAELGWFGVGLPEAAGGSGLGLVEEILIQRECGRHLVSPNMLARVMAGHVAIAAGDAEAASQFACGERACSFAVLHSGNEGAAFLLDWNGADAVVASAESGMHLFEPDALAVPIPCECVDESVTLATSLIEFDKATSLVAPGTASLGLRLDVLLAASLAGLALGACELAVEYAKIREQFGKPIGSFQAIKHRCADMAVRQRLAWYQTCLGALKLQAGADDAGLQVASAMLLASEAARENGRACIQIHGGIGFQAECDAHWFLKRALVYDLAGGGEAVQADRIIAAPEPAW